jgi:hypothetical protein
VKVIYQNFTKLPTGILIILKVYLLVANLRLDAIKNLHGQCKVFRVIKKVFRKYFSAGELYFSSFVLFYPTTTVSE